MTLCVLNAAEGQLDMLVGQSTEAVPLCAQSWQAASRGAELLIPALADMLGRLHMAPGHVQQWACVRGPGSFTGLRLVLSTVAGIRRVTGASNAGLDYMLCLASAGQRQSAQPHEGQAHIWVLTHARRDVLHCQCFARSEHGLPLPLAPVEMCSPLDAAQRMQHSPPGSVALGSAVPRHGEILAPAWQHVRPLSAVLPEAQDLWLVARAATYDHHDVEPLYVRHCDAVDNLSHIAQKKGMEAHVAHARLAALLNTVPGPSSEPQSAPLAD